MIENKKYLPEMHILRGIATVLVVLGHSIPISIIRDKGSIYEIIFDFIYSFHMPIFFFMSGFFAYKIITLRNKKEKNDFLKEKFIRLLIPYITLTSVSIILKLMLSSLVKRKINFNTLLIDIFIYPWNNPLKALWFLYTLFIIYLIVIAFKKVDIKLMLVITFIINLIRVEFTNNIFDINGILKYLFYFYLGMNYKSFYKSKYKISYNKIVYIISGVILIGANTIMYKYNNNNNVLLLITGVSGIVFTLNIAYKIKNIIIIKILNCIANYSFDIYI